jgi:X-Pro dipeptidyl-peptidase
LHLSAGGATAGALAATATGKQGRETLTDNVEFDGASLAKAGSSSNRLMYATDVLAQPVHISGFSKMTIRMASSKPAANLSVWLVQLPWTDGPISTDNLITRGWADPQNWKSLTTGGDYHSKAPGVPLKPGEFVTFTFMLQPDDQIIPPGKRIALMIMSSDRDFTLWPTPGTQLTVDLAGTSVTLPIVGGLPALTQAIKK